MRQETKRTIHFGVNFFFAPAISIDHSHALSLQQAVGEGPAGIHFDQSQRADSSLQLARKSPPLSLTIGLQGPVAQLLAVSTNPSQLVDEFVTDVRQCLTAYEQVWPGQRTVVRRDATLRYLYAVKGEHSLQYLWEQRLGHSGEEMRVFGRPILGGGIRLVFPPLEDDPGQGLVEVKVETFLQDPRQMFVEVMGVWEQGIQFDALDPKAMVDQLESFATGPLAKFMALENHNG